MMNEFTKNVVLMICTALFGAAISSFSTVSSLGADIAVLGNEVVNIKRSVDAIAINQGKFGDRLRKAEIYQAQFKREYIAAN